MKEVIVESHEHLDLLNFEFRFDSNVLLDGVGDTGILKKNREALQGRPKLAKGAQSATRVDSYQYTPCRRAMVATFELSAKGLDAFKTDHWLQNPLKVVQLWLTEKAFYETAVPGTCAGRAPAVRSKRLCV